MNPNTTQTIEHYPAVNAIDLEEKVKSMYREVASNPEGDFHFEMGRTMAERLGYEPLDLDRIPSNAIDSFAGVGYFFDLADIQAGESVVDLGSGSGMDTFVAALKTGPEGSVYGIDMTDEQIRKAESLRKLYKFKNVSYIGGYIQSTEFTDNRFDVVISNGVINLAVDKKAVFAEAKRILKPGGRLAISDIVTEVHLPEGITCDATLWAACIGGASHEDDYVEAICSAGFEIKEVRENRQYQFISDNAKWATDKYGVKSISILAVKQ
ncbi:MAG: arsenite methyltransferase [Gammaproteobacteria bacterium]|nr:MAG: arsenite methyltransferase [Gammaproteobacteria bacterium]